jgi:hypothetical protein
LWPVVSKRQAYFHHPRTPVSRLSKQKGRTMPEPEGPRFIHEKKADGGFDSICIGCVVLVASAKREDDLIPYESTHVCDPIRLYQVGQGRVPPVKLSE